MSDLKFAAVAAGFAMAACSAAAEPVGRTQTASLAPQAAHVQPKGAAQDLSCDVTASPTPNGVLIEAHALADRDVYGEYDLVITKSGEGGSSDVSQGGEVALLAGAPEMLGSTELSLERGASVRARLVVSDEQGELCRRTVRL